MYVAFAIRTEPELEFVKILFCLTERESEAAVVLLCEEFADDVPVEMDRVSFPNDPMPSEEQKVNPKYVQEVRNRITSVYFGDPEWMVEFDAVMNAETCVDVVAPGPPAT